jgi:hypothetical protein
MILTDWLTLNVLLNYQNENVIVIENKNVNDVHETGI